MIVGLDIGTHWARAACLDEHGVPRLVHLPRGATALPAVARQTLHGLEIGGDAGSMLAGNAETTLRACTRLLGRPGTLPSRLLERLPYGVRVEAGEAICNLLYAEVSAAEVYGRLAAALVEAASRHTGMDAVEVVLTVPASADDRFRVQARAAVEAQGIRVRRLVNQPTAALLAAPLPPHAVHIAVVYCGDGSTDVTIAKRQVDRVEILGTAGDMWLGGEDLVWTVADRLNERFQTLSGIDIYGVGDGPAAALGLRHAAETALRGLRGALQTTVVIDHGGGFGQDLVAVVHRHEVDGWLAPDYAQVAALAERALRQSGLAPHQIDTVLLVGDWTEFPGLREQVAAIFARPVADLVVAGAPLLPVYGAALASAQSGWMVWDVTPYPLGINCYFGDRPLLSPIIRANTPIPTPPAGAPEAFVESYQTREPNQTSVQIDILQYRGERDPIPFAGRGVPPEECELLGTWTFAGLHPGRGKHAAFTVSFAVDESGILHLVARETGTGHTLSTHVNRSIG